MNLFEEKYTDMMRNGKDAIKNKLMWSFSDMRKKGSPILETKVSFNLHKINIILETKKIISGGSIPDPFLKLQSEDLAFDMEVFANGNVNKTFHITHLNVINLRETSSNPYHYMIEMDHEDNLAIFVTLEECDLS